MKPLSKLALAAGAVGAGVVAARAYRATHPPEVWSEVGGGRRPRLPDELFAVPDDVVHHTLTAADGGTIHAIERGAGRPLVLLHGVTLRSDVWAPQLHQLADRYRVIAVDLRGHGASTAGSAGYGIGRLADDLATLLVELDLRHAVVVGHSMGGMTLMHFCGAHPDVLAERVDGLIFLATRAHRVVHPMVERGARTVLGYGQAAVEAGQALPPGSTVGFRAARLAFGERPSPTAVAIVAEMGGSMDPAAMVPSLAGLMDHDAREALRATHTPAVVAVGTRDVLTPVPAGRHLAHLLPDAELVVLPRAGHQLMQERPDEVATLIDRLVARLEG